MRQFRSSRFALLSLALTSSFALGACEKGEEKAAEPAKAEPAAPAAEEKPAAEAADEGEPGAAEAEEGEEGDAKE